MTDNDQSGKDDIDPSGLQAEVDKWKALARKHEGQAKANFEELTKLKSAADASKSDMDKVNEKITALEKRAVDAEAKALRAEVAQEKGLTAGQAKRLAGATREELLADAEELLEAFGAKAPGKDDDPGEDREDEGLPLGRPREMLRPGASPPTEGDGRSAEQLADAVLKKARGY